MSINQGVRDGVQTERHQCLASVTWLGRNQPESERFDNEDGRRHREIRGIQGGRCGSLRQKQQRGLVPPCWTKADCLEPLPPKRPQCQAWACRFKLSERDHRVWFSITQNPNSACVSLFSSRVVVRADYNGNRRMLNIRMLHSFLCTSFDVQPDLLSVLHVV